MVSPIVSRLKVQNLGDTITSEDVVTSSDSLGESKPEKESADVSTRNRTGLATT
jgi:hypothetical protein